ncbi:MAG TPA: hypothetical protein ENJ09_00995 [Planctomycetes bacterium]|nr:hypothetical protein [Planctomycetota bacterium]
MKIHFCDLCNESVPQADLDEGRAVLVRGRVICAVCEGAMSKGPGGRSEHGAEARAEEVGQDTTIVDPSAAPPLPPRPQAPRGGGGVGTALASLALLAVIGAAAYLHDWIGKRDQRLEEFFREQRAERSAALSDLEARLGRRMDSTRVRVDELAKSLRELDARVSEAASATGETRALLGAKLDEFADRSETLSGLAADIARQGGVLETLARTTSTLHDDVLRLVGRVRDLETGAAAGAAQGDPVSATLQEQRSPDWLPLLGDLASEDAGTRWQAVQALGATRDPAVAEHIAPLLKDPDLFVRMAAARILGDLESRASVPALIDALEDAEASVREAAVVSLRSITGKSFRFDPAGKEADRAKRIRSWRDWWKKEERKAAGSS